MPKSVDPDIDNKIMLCTSEWETPFSTDISANKASVMQRIALLDDPKETTQFKHRSFPWMKVAATIIILIICGSALYLLENRSLKNDSTKSILCTLPNGSEILLAPKSSVSYNALIWPLKRSVNFSGEGFFTIQKGKPFKVYTDSGVIEVIGTKFTIWADQNDLFVHCSSGHVKVTHDDEETDLLTSEFTLLENGNLTKKMYFQNEGFIASRITNRLNFKAVPVGIVISELEKIFHKEIINMLPANLIYTGVLDTRNENECLEVFCKPFGAKFQKNADGDISIHL